MKRQGSMTVFAALLFMLVASMLFALLEAARVNMLNLYANMTSELALESVFAEYQPELWRNYRLLCLDGAYGSASFSEEYVESVLGTRIRENLDTTGDGSRIMHLSFVSATPEEYLLLTDGEGRVFLHRVSEYMRGNISAEAIQALYERCVSRQAVGEDSPVNQSVQTARDALTQAQEEKKSRIRDANLLDTVWNCKQNILLGMVVEDVEALSVQKIQRTNCLEHRSREMGTSSRIPKVGIYDRILVLEYADRYFADYNTCETDRSFAYELEYIVGGKASDRENLEAVVERLLLAREAANVIHILMNQEKRLVVSETAVALAGATANPALIKAVEYGLIGAWAYAESILDIRALLCGDRVALVKSEKEWTSSLENLPQILEGSLRAMDCEGGFCYQDYLKGFLFAMSESTLAYRMLDVMEQNMRRIDTYKNCRMDHMISSMCYTITYDAQSLFWNFSILSHNDIGRMQYQNRKSFSYD